MSGSLVEEVKLAIYGGPLVKFPYECGIVVTTCVGIEVTPGCK